MDMGAPQSGQYGTNSDGTRIAFCSRTILLTTVSLSYVRLWQGFELAPNHNLLAYKTVSACQIQLSENNGLHLLSARSNPCSVPDEIGFDTLVLVDFDSD